MLVRLPALVRVDVVDEGLLELMDNASWNILDAMLGQRPVEVTTATAQGQVIGLNDVSVSVPPGVTGLLGPNGAGKSTFMKLITGQLKPSKGDVTILGE